LFDRFSSCGLDQHWILGLLEWYSTEIYVHRCRTAVTGGEAIRTAVACLRPSKKDIYQVYLHLAVHGPRPDLAVDHWPDPAVRARGPAGGGWRRSITGVRASPASQLSFPALPVYIFPLLLSPPILPALRTSDARHSFHLVSAPTRIHPPRPSRSLLASSWPDRRSRRPPCP